MATFTINRAGDAPHAQVHHPSGPSGSIAYRTGSPYDQLFGAILVSIEQVAGEADSVRSRYTPDALDEHIRNAVTRFMRTPYAALRNKIQADRRSQAERVAELSAPPKDTALASEDRAAFRALAIGKRHHWVASADRAALAAIVSVGRARWPEIDDAAWQAAIDRLNKLAVIELTGIAGRFPLVAKPDRPAPIGPDAAAVEAYAETALANFRAATDAADIAEAFLSRTVAITAVAGNLQVVEAFALLDRAA